mmetsp:Transcript_13749/g.36845  ORF Transcript_13749/g.36845 Transcript_13749/m.36845 type:complete len:201 (+) Transcript_13749:637-1239(+)
MIWSQRLQILGRIYLAPWERRLQYASGSWVLNFLVMRQLSDCRQTDSHLHSIAQWACSELPTPCAGAALARRAHHTSTRSDGPTKPEVQGFMKPWQGATATGEPRDRAAHSYHELNNPARCELHGGNAGYSTRSVIRTPAELPEVQPRTGWRTARPRRPPRDCRVTDVTDDDHARIASRSRMNCRPRNPQRMSPHDRTRA